MPKMKSYVNLLERKWAMIVNAGNTVSEVRVTGKLKTTFSDKKKKRKKSM